MKLSEISEKSQGVVERNIWILQIENRPTFAPSSLEQQSKVFTYLSNHKKARRN